jgi:hypothetical protein
METSSLNFRHHSIINVNLLVFLIFLLFVIKTPSLDILDGATPWVFYGIFLVIFMGCYIDRVGLDWIRLDRVELFGWIGPIKLIG